jgi:ATP-binding cassette, subfamily B, multidrug efflux pump
MSKLIRYLKPYGWWVALIFVLLFGQAMADLSLPAYMSDIVNVGIQQNGIDRAVPKALPQSEFNRLTLFMSADDKARISSDYILLDKSKLSTADYDRYVKDYPALATMPIEKLNTTDGKEIEAIDSTFARSITVVAAIESGKIPMSGNITLPPGTDIFTVLPMLPQAQQEAIHQAVSTQLATMPDTMLKQFSTAYISAQYKAMGMNAGAIQNAYMWHIGLIMLLITLASATASIIVGFISARVAGGLGRDLRRKVFTRVESFSNTEIDKFSTASLITRSTNDITQIQMMMVMLFRILFYAPIIGIGGIIKVLGADDAIIWIIVLAVALILALIGIMFGAALPKFRSMQGLIDRLNLVTREILTGQMVVRAFNTEKTEEKKFDAANQELTNVGLFINRVMVFMMPFMMLVMNGVMLLIVWVGGHQVANGTTQVGSLMAFMQYAMQIIFAFLMVAVIFIMVPRASISATRIAEVLDTEPAIRDPESPKAYTSKDGQKGLVEFKNVSFRYPGAEDDVLKDITFTAKPGAVTAFIGSTGSGKSTLINLVPRFYDATGGQVLVDGINVKEVKQGDLRDRIGYVSQKATLFSGTIESNIKYANENASKEQIAKFIEIAQASDFIKPEDGGLEMPVAQGAINFSGGQKQRLAIARALAKKPEIYIFDDALSALDFRTELALRKALMKETGESTVLIVTQRVSTVMTADEIVVLDNGRVAGTGTHEKLMKECEVYREIAQSQLSKEELGQ